MDAMQWWQEKGREELVLRTYSEAIYELASLIRNNYTSEGEIIKDLRQVLETGGLLCTS